MVAQRNFIEADNRKEIRFVFSPPSAVQITVVEAGYYVNIPMFETSEIATAGMLVRLRLAGPVPLGEFGVSPISNFVTNSEKGTDNVLISVK